jgi:hypothetical protein
LSIKKLNKGRVNMLELFDKDLRALKENLRKYKIESFDELFQVVTENEKLKKKIINLQENLSSEIAKLKSAHEIEMLTIKHTVKLERERYESEGKQKFAEKEHQLSLKIKEFEKDKEILQLDLQRQIFEERKIFLETNFKDIKEDANNNLDRSVKILSMFLDKINYTSQHKLIAGKDNVNESTVNIHEK